MGTKGRNGRRSGAIQKRQSPYSGRPVFNDYKGGVENTGLFCCVDIYPKDDVPYYKVSDGYKFDSKGNLYWSRKQWFKYHVRRILGFPVKSRDPRDLVTWRRSKRSLGE